VENPKIDSQGEFLKRYEILEEIGTGGFGVVHKARQISTGQIVAIKTLLLGLTKNVDARGEQAVRFLREMRLIGNLSSPHVVRLLDAGFRDDDPFMVLEFIRGEPLSKVLRQGPLPLDIAKRVIGQVLEALAEAHNLGIVHRDLKPSNIMISGSGILTSAKVLDFGIAGIQEHFRENDPNITQAGQILGTPAYMAPEQFILFAEPRPFTDIYAAGLILFECLTGNAAVSGASMEVIKNQVYQPLILPPGLVNTELGEVILHACEKEAEKRFASAEDMLIALHAASLEIIPEHLRVQRHSSPEDILKHAQRLAGSRKTNPPSAAKFSDPSTQNQEHPQLQHNTASASNLAPSNTGLPVGRIPAGPPNKLSALKAALAQSAEKKAKNSGTPPASAALPQEQPAPSSEEPAVEARADTPPIKSAPAKAPPLPPPVPPRPPVTATPAPPLQDTSSAPAATESPAPASDLPPEPSTGLANKDIPSAIPHHEPATEGHPDPAPDADIPPHATASLESMLEDQDTQHTATDLPNADELDFALFGPDSAEHESIPTTAAPTTLAPADAPKDAIDDRPIAAPLHAKPKKLWPLAAGAAALLVLIAIIWIATSASNDQPPDATGHGTEPPTVTPTPPPAVTPDPPPAPTPQELLAQAQQAYDTEDFPLAAQLTLTVLDSDPQQLEAHLLRGQALAKNNQCRGALPHLESAQDDPQHGPPALLTAAQCHHELGDAGSALAALTTLIERFPEHPLADEARKAKEVLAQDQPDPTPVEPPTGGDDTKRQPPRDRKDRERKGPKGVKIVDI